jgi:hypothetical protein
VEASMPTKELIKEEIDAIPDEAIDELYDLVKDFKESKQKKGKSTKSFFEVARGLKLDLPPDFSTRYHEYLYGDTSRTREDE